MRGHLIGGGSSIFERENRCGEGLVVSFFCLLTALARSKETPGGRHGVRGPLLPTWGEEFVRKAAIFTERLILFRLDCSATHRSAKSRQLQSREFDETLGYPGEDISLALSVWC